MIQCAWLTYAPLSLSLMSILDFLKWTVILAIISSEKALKQAGRYARYFTVRDAKDPSLTQSLMPFQRMVLESRKEKAGSQATQMTWSNTEGIFLTNKTAIYCKGFRKHKWKAPVKEMSYAFLRPWHS